MNNCLILGSGRSGTSMLAGMLHQAGYYMGEKLHLPRDSNPKGFFEWYRVNRINEEILAAHDRRGLKGRFVAAVLKKHTVDSPGKSQRWLMAVPDGSELGPVPAGLEAEMRAVLQRRPHAFKDPRFSYTLPAWAPLLVPGTVLLCVFRDPAVTVASMLKECRSQAYLADLFIGRRDAFRVWTAIYRNVVERLLPRFPSLHVVHYNQVLDGSARERLESALQTRLSWEFADPRLARTRSRRPAPPAARQLYARLCALAGYAPSGPES